MRASRVEALFRCLGAQVSDLDNRRLQIRMPSGQETWIHTGAGLHQPDLDGDAVMRVRHFLQEAGVTPTASCCASTTAARMCSGSKERRWSMRCSVRT